MRNNYNRALAIPLWRGQGEDMLIILPLNPLKGTSVPEKPKITMAFCTLKVPFRGFRGKISDFVLKNMSSISSPCPLQRGIANARFQ